MNKPAIAMEQHVWDLCADHAIELVEYKGNGRSWTYRNSKRRMIEIKPVRGPVTYFTALHEIGHLIGKGRSGLKLEQEAMAWKWALDNAIREPTLSVRKDIKRSLGSYLKAGRRSWGMRQNMKEPTEDHIFWVLLEKGSACRES